MQWHDCYYHFWSAVLLNQGCSRATCMGMIILRGHLWPSSTWLNAMDGGEMVTSGTLSSPAWSPPLYNYSHNIDWEHQKSAQLITPQNSVILQKAAYLPLYLQKCVVLASGLICCACFEGNNNKAAQIDQEKKWSMDFRHIRGVHWLARYT